MRYYTSDPHYDHKNICRGTTSWKEVEEGSSHQETRDFDTLEKMNFAIVDGINKVVLPDDELYCLGDWSFNGKENIKKFRDRLNCNNIHLIFGNHDQWITPPKSPYRKLFTSTDYYKEVQFGKGRYDFFCLFHYAIAPWNSRHRGSYHLYGHSHNTFPDRGDRSMDVGVDTNNFIPYSEDEILSHLSKRVNKPIDHHTKNTN